MIQAHEINPPVVGPLAPVRLDDVIFASMRPETETAWRDGALIGELEHDDAKDRWRARKLTAPEGWSEWHPARCRAEARAFLVSKVRV